MNAIAAIVPAFRAEGTLKRCLDALFRADFQPDDILLVDDGSDDSTFSIAQAAGVRVIQNNTTLRPAQTRNRGVYLTTAPILLFVDADVEVEPDIRARLLKHFEDPELAAVFGSYDAAPEGSIIARYRNLLHHYVHQKNAGPVETFWSGLGAMRSSTFREVGGFDPAWDFMEDVELGLRVTDRGHRVLLDPCLQGKHLKHWTLHSMIRTDFWGRAVPWAHLLRLRRHRMGKLNTSLGHRISAAGLLIALIALFVAPFHAAALWLFAAGLLTFLLPNAGFFSFLARLNGPLFALAAVPLHKTHTAVAIAGILYANTVERRRQHVSVRDQSASENEALS